MIYIGLTGWGDHHSLYENISPSREKLREYAAHFPIVELDASFYAIQSHKNMEKWVRETPETFQFIVKAYQGMTGHARGDNPFATKDEMFAAFLHSLQPLVEAGKLAMVLFQFPPWFACMKQNVTYLRYCRAKMGDIPVALEFRHQSWYYPQLKEKTIHFMKKEKWIHSICDEPQAGLGSIPIILEATDEGKTLVRFHGRNIHGWRKPNKGNWRKVRYLYRYNEQELLEWKARLNALKEQTKNIYVIFNNNSGGDAADNGKQFIEMLNIQYEGLAPRQLELF